MAAQNKYPRGGASGPSEPVDARPNAGGTAEPPDDSWLTWDQVAEEPANEETRLADATDSKEPPDTSWVAWDDVEEEE